MAVGGRAVRCGGKGITATTGGRWAVIVVRGANTRKRKEEDAIVRRERHNRERRKTRGGRGKT
jgi:hypothetical protein